MKLQELIDEAAKTYSFDQLDPAIKELGEDKKKGSAIRHIFLHQNKANGVLSGVIEQFEHGKELNGDQLKAAIHKSIKNSFALAKIAGISAEDIVRHLVPSKFAHETAVTKV